MNLDGRGAREAALITYYGSLSLFPVLLLGVAIVSQVLARRPALRQERAGRVYGAFATVAGVFTLLYLLSNALVLAAEVAVVRHARLWPRALDPSRPAPADLRVMELLAREQERTPGDRFSYTRRDSG